MSEYFEQPIPESLRLDFIGKTQETYMALGFTARQALVMAAAVHGKPDLVEQERAAELEHNRYMQRVADSLAEEESIVAEEHVDEEQ